ncbi:MAG: hypothetical protein A3F25_00545 [Candidatus Yanofskybacteria bacterium RIFCSPHIGHO2_12_FULL_45_19b]|uniref:O-antigen ligase-related domain-containing protein n=1 Tax=Candidatus Yanofskybacteria bacterium RIFCSPHIGHO2_12_FULL_45_19b TaxID=1802689 RepID=A0A1F8G2M4_9BACT|nr:MAG: hypothetical protein A3F25_00545 [Candidatus Yanofskybacteria bacterium RIFCSPHIGHO2_12_FULL_45_19b]
MLKETNLTKLVRWGVYLVALVPLIIFSDYLSPFHFGKVVVMRAWIEILAVLYLVLVMRDRRWLPRATPLFWAITAFSAVFGVTAFAGGNIYQSVMGTMERMGGWFTFLHYWLFFVIMTGMLRTREQWVRLIKISVVVSLLSTFYGFLQKTNWDLIVGAGGRSRIFGTIGNPALFAGYELVNVFFALWLLLSPAQTKSSRWFYGIAFLLNLIAVFSTAVRGSLLASVLGLGLMVWLYVRQRGFLRLTRWLVVLLVFLVVGEGLLVLNRQSDFVQSSPYFSRLSDVSSQTRTVQTRFWAWQAGIDGWNDSYKTILLGYGPENFNLPFSNHFNPLFYQGSGSETFFDRAHNMFVEVLVTMGLVGIVAYLTIFLVLIKILWKIYKKAQHKEDASGAAVLLSGLLAYLVHNLFIFDTSANFIVLFVFIGLTSFLYDINFVQRKETVEATKPLRYSAPLVAVLLVAVIFSVLKTSIQPARANYVTTRGIVASWAGDYAGALVKFKEALAYDTFGKYEICHRFAQYVFENMSAYQPKQRSELLLYLIDQLKKNIPPQDNDYLPYLYISRTYIVLGKDDPKSLYNDLALQNSLRALEIAPTFVRTYYEIGQAYLNKRDYIRAKENFRKALDLNPTVGLSWWYLAVTQLDSEQTAEGINSIEQAIALGYNGFREHDLTRLISVYSGYKPINYERLVWLYEHLLVLQPEQPSDATQASKIANYYAQLAAAYFGVDRLDEAVMAAQQAVRLDPSFRSEAEKFVHSFGRTL